MIQTQSVSTGTPIPTPTRILLPTDLREMPLATGTRGVDVGARARPDCCTTDRGGDVDTRPDSTDRSVDVDT